MRSITRGKNLIVALILSICCLIAGLFFMEKKEPALTVSAEEVTTERIEGFDMVPGAALNTENGRQELRISVTLSKEMIDNLKSSSKGPTGNIIPSNYYLKLIVEPQDGGDSYSILYHNDPKHSKLAAEQLIIAEDTARLVVPFGSDFQAEYKYYCEYGKSQQIHVNSGCGYKIWEYKALASTSTTVTRSVSYIAQRVLENEGEWLTTEELNWFNFLAGYANPGNTDIFPVIVSYKAIDTNGLITVKTFNFQTGVEYIGCPTIIYRDVMQRKGWKSLDVFNVVLKNPDGTDERIVLVADGYTYEYDNKSGAGYLNITYRQFDYNNFCIRLQDNNPDDGMNLYYHIPVTQASKDTNTSLMTLTFDFSDIGEKCLKGYNAWLFKLKAKNFTVTKPEDSPITHVLTDNELKIKFKPEDEDQLQYVFVGVLADIVEDKPYMVNLQYTELSFENGTIVDVTATESVEMLYSEWFYLNSYTTFQESELYDVVTDALAVPALKDKKYLLPNGVEGEYNDAEGTLTLRVLYEYNTLLQITDNSGNVNYVECEPSEREYRIAKLGVAAPQGWRIKSLTSTSPDVEIDFEEAKANDFKVTVHGELSEKKIIPLTITYSNIWNLDIVYMETYKETPFAERKVKSITFTVGKYDLENFTLKDVKNILGRKDDMKICGITRPIDEVSVEWTSESTYTATVLYGHGSLIQIDYNGNRKEIAVPLTSFSDWCTEFDEDLTVLALNKDPKEYPDSKKYFEDEVDFAGAKRDNLYGFFSVAVFEEKASDIQALFRSNTSGGIVVSFMEKEVVGSKLYEFISGLKNTIFSPLGINSTIGMAFCELVNDDNKTLYSYSFYMDATEGYISNGGADDAHDDDTAIKNWWEEPETQKGVRVVLALLGVASTIASIVGLVWLKRKLGIPDPTPSPRPRPSGGNGGKSSTKKRKSKKSKKSGKKKPRKTNKKKSSRRRSGKTSRKTTNKRRKK